MDNPPELGKLVLKDELRDAMPTATILDLSGTGKGCPDIAVGWLGYTFLFEIKDGEKPPSRRKLTPKQQKFFDGWAGQAAVIFTAQDALRIMEIEYEYSTR